MKLFRLSVLFAAAMAISCSSNDRPFLPEASQGLHFSELPAVWDEAVPIGNGLVGALIWEKDGRLRLGLDRADLWDLRDVPEFDSPDYSYEFVIDQVVNKKDMSIVDKMIDRRTSESSFPTKIPAGGLEFDIAALGEVESVDLDIADAVCDVVWKNGAKAQFFIPADACGGYFRFENAGQIVPQLKTPAYEGDRSVNHERQGGKGNSLATLGYSAGNVDGCSTRRRLPAECPIPLR